MQYIDLKELYFPVFHISRSQSRNNYLIKIHETHNFTMYFMHFYQVINYEAMGFFW